MKTVSSRHAGAPRGVRAHPIREGFNRLGVKTTKGHQLTKPGPNGEPPEIQTFMIGRCRYVTESELQRFIQARIEQSIKETASDRSAKVKAAMEARARQREKLACRQEGDRNSSGGSEKPRLTPPTVARGAHAGEDEIPSDPCR